MPSLVDSFLCGSSRISTKLFSGLPFRFAGCLLVVLCFTLNLCAQSAPQIDSISPMSAVPGTQITFTGSNFGATQGSSSVFLAGDVRTSIVSWSDTQIVAILSPYTGSNEATFITVNGASSNVIYDFTVIKARIDGVSPMSAVPGTQITFTGSNFGATQGSSWVLLGGYQPASIVSWSDTQVVAILSPYAGSNETTYIAVNGAASNVISNFNVIVPHIDSISPMTATPGTAVTFTGATLARRRAPVKWHWGERFRRCKAGAIRRL